MVSSASASSLAKASSSSYSPGRPSRSRMIRPDPAHPAHPDAQKIKTTTAMKMMDPNEETRPTMTPVKAEEGGSAVMMETRDATARPSKRDAKDSSELGEKRHGRLLCPHDKDSGGRGGSSRSRNKGRESRGAR